MSRENVHKERVTHAFGAVLGAFGDDPLKMFTADIATCFSNP